MFSEFVADKLGYYVYRLCVLVRAWSIDSAMLDGLFRKARDRCMVGDLRFHDARATALTLLARKVDVLTLSRISRHRDLRILSQVYYRESAEEIARRLARLSPASRLADHAGNFP